MPEERASESQLDPARDPARALEVLPCAVLVIDQNRRVALANQAALALLARAADEVVGRPAAELIRLTAPGEAGASGARGAHGDVEALVGERAAELVCAGAAPLPVGAAGTPLPVRVAGTPLRDRTGALIGVVCTLEDLSGRRLAELDLRRADQMQVVGGLAAGIAHEINTPIQFIGDTVSFLGDAFADLGRVLEAARALRRELEARGDAGQLALPLAELEAECDVEFLRAEIPGAVERAADGVRRVSRIVRALKEFAHPGGVEKAPANLAAAVETTLAVAKNEYKHVADVELALETLPPVECHLGDVNQVLLNLIVNAAHAIEARAGKGRGRGHIRIAARRAGDDVVISVADDGCGIPEEIRARVFEPFFTTKAAGKGTGQGLALAQRIVVERHGGCLWFESERGRGTTFHLSLPIRSGRGARAA